MTWQVEGNLPLVVCQHVQGPGVIVVVLQQGELFDLCRGERRLERLGDDEVVTELDDVEHPGSRGDNLVEHFSQFVHSLVHVSRLGPLTGAALLHARRSRENCGASQQSH